MSTRKTVAVIAWGVDEATVPQERRHPITQHLESMGLNLVSNNSKPDEVVMLEFAKKVFQELQSSEVRMHLVIFEPRAVHPQQFVPEVRQRFSTVISNTSGQTIGLANDRVVFGGGLSDSWREEVHWEGFKDWLKRSTEVRMLQANKFSLIQGSLYHRRKSVARAILKSGIDVVIGGENWSRGIGFEIGASYHAFSQARNSGEPIQLSHLLSLRPRVKDVSYVGKVENTYSFLSKAKYNLCLENDIRYFSEKPFNAIISGAIPIYGESNADLLGLQDKAFISDTEIQMLSYLSDGELWEIVTASRDWISSELVQNSHLNSVHFRRIAEALVSASV